MNQVRMYYIISSVWILSVIVSLFLISLQEVLGYTGKEIVIKLGIKVNVSFTVSDPTLIGQKVNAVMKVHPSNGSVIKTTSFPNGFIANKTDSVRMLTNIPILLAKYITTETVFTDLNKTVFLSNVVKAIPTISGLNKSSDFTPANKT
jgi:hypothetical protein